MKHFTIWILLQQLLLLVGASYLLAQTRAITSEGHEVILYPNGTWEYLQSSPRPNQQPPVSVAAGATGRRVGILMHRQLLFVLNDGKLEDLLIYDNRGNLVFSYREGAYHLPYGWHVQYALGSNRVRSVGPYEFEYDILSGRLEEVGDYDIEYDFLSDRIEEIGDVRIDYDFMTGRIKRVGGIRIEYDFFTNDVERITGRDSRVELHFMREG